MAFTDNSLTAFNQVHWAPTMQDMFFKENVALAICNTELRDILVDGTRVQRPYRSSLKSQTYTKGTEISSFNALTATEEYLDVDTTRLVSFYVDDLDSMQNKWNTVDLYAADAQKKLNNDIDQAIFSLYSSAGSYISAQDLGGSGTGAIAVTSGNVFTVFTTAARILNKYNRGLTERFAVIGPRLLQELQGTIAGRETSFGETVGANGYVGNRFGFELYLSNNIPFSTTVVTSGIPTDGQKFYVDGVEFTWEAHGTNCASAGEVDIGTNEDEAYANLVLAINGTTAGTTATYCDVSADDRETLNSGGISASYTTHALVISGYGDVVVSYGDTSNVTSVTTTSYPIFGIKKSIDFVIQKSPVVEFRTCENYLGKKVYAHTTYGKKVFTKEKKGLVYLKMDASSWI